MEAIRRLYHKHREGFLYLLFGGLTTLVNYVVYAGCFALFPGTTTLIPNLTAWVVAVLFAYWTNRVWVFRSEARGAEAVLRELGAFAGARVFTLLVETALLWLTVDVYHWNNWVMKLVANVVVVLLNYALSKFWIFRSKSER